MKKLIFLIVICVIVSCESSTQNPTPEVILTPEKMEAMLYDLALLQSIKNSNFISNNKDTIYTLDYIQRKHQVDSVLFAANQRYYSENPKRLIEIYERINARLQDSIDSIEQRIKDEIPNRN